MYEHQITKKTGNVTNSPEQTQQAGVSAKKQAAKMQDQFNSGLFNQNNMLQLQRTIGNRATARLMHESGAVQIQAKLKVGRPGDRYEQEADDVANQVVDYLNAPEGQPNRREASHGKPQLKPADTVLQRQEGEEEELQMKPAGDLIQRQEGEEEELQMKPAGAVIQRQEGEEEELQLKPAGGLIQRQEGEEEELQMMPLFRQNTEKSRPAGLDLGSAIQLARGGGQPIETHLQRKMGRAFGADFSSVKVYTGTQSDLLNRSLGAKAFTTGQDIFFRSGEYSPGSSEGQKLLAHELTHVVQQTGTRQKSLKPVQLKTNDSAVVQMSYGDIDAWLKGEAKKDEKELLVGFFSDLPELKQKIAMYAMAYKMEIAELQDRKKAAILIARSQAQPEPSKEGFMDSMKEIKFLKLRKGVNWNRFSDVVRAVKDMPLENYNQSGTMEDTALVTTGLGAGASAAGQIGKISGGGALSTAVTAPISSGFGAVTSVLNVASIAARDREGLSGHDQAQDYAEMGAGTADFSQSTASTVASAKDFSNLASGGDLAQGAATTAMGVAAIAGGAITLGSGVHGAFVHNQRQKELEKMQEKYKDNKSLARAATLGATAENIKRDTSAITAAKGAAMIAGGVLLAATAATGVGLLVLGVAALIGGVGAVLKWWRGRTRKEEIVDKYLGVKEKLSTMETKGGKKPDEGKVRQGLLMKSGFNSLDQCYVHIVTEQSKEIHQKGVQGEDPEYMELIDKLGLEISKDKKHPTVDQIAQKLHV